MATAETFNDKVIREFRQNGGRVGPPFEGMPLLLLHTTGRVTGHEHVNPVVYRTEDDGWAIFATNGGAEADPEWYRNLVAVGRAQVEIGDDAFDVVAKGVAGPERERIWTAQVADAPSFAGYEQKTNRLIPVVILARTT